MLNLLIIGARGYGREVFWLAPDCAGYESEFVVKGFLDDKADALDGLWEGYPPIISSVEDYVPGDDDVFICALGDPKYRRIYAEKILAKGGRFINLISTKASIHPSVKLGHGNIVSSRCSLSNDVKVGDFNVFHSDVVVGHDTVIGDYSFFGTRVFIGGNARIGDMVALNPQCSIHPHVTVEDGAVVGSNSAVIRKVKAGTTVIGVPAIRVKY